MAGWKLAVGGFVIVVVAVAATLVLSRGGSDPSEGQAITEGTAVRDAALPTILSEPVDPVATQRCERLDYPCTWGDAGVDAVQRTLAVLDELEEVMDEHLFEPERALHAAADLLTSRDDLAEMLPDQVLHTGLEFRLDGGLPAFVPTLLAVPYPGELEDDAAELDGDATEEPAPAASDRRAVPVTSRVQPASFRPAGGPRPHGGPGGGGRKVLILDPYHTYNRGCENPWHRHRDLPGANLSECRRTSERETEGDAIAAIFASQGGYDVEYLVDQQVTPASVLAVASYDLVHVISHGSGSCPEGQPDACYSRFAIGRMDDEERAAFEADPSVFDHYGEEIAVSTGRRWWADTSLLANAPDTVVFANSCTSALGPVGASTTGSLVGWDGYAGIRSAANAAQAFWRLMVDEGVEFEVAMQRLGDQGLTHSRPVKLAETLRLEGVARLVSNRGENLRARDIVTTFLDDRPLADGAQIPLDGQVEAAEPAAIDGLRFDVDGVADGSPQRTWVQLFLDDQPASQRINVLENGSVERQGEGYADWQVSYPDLPLEAFLFLDDVNPASAKEFGLEVRVFEDPDRYSAQGFRQVTFVVDLVLHIDVGFWRHGARAQGQAALRYDSGTRRYEGEGDVAVTWEPPSDGTICSFGDAAGQQRLVVKSLEVTDTGWQELSAMVQALGGDAEMPVHCVGRGEFGGDVDVSVLWGVPFLLLADDHSFIPGGGSIFTEWDPGSEEGMIVETSRELVDNSLRMWVTQGEPASGDGDVSGGAGASS